MRWPDRKSVCQENSGASREATDPKKTGFRLDELESELSHAGAWEPVLGMEALL